MRITDKELEKVMTVYDDAIHAANKYSTEPTIALANELAGKFWIEKGKPEFAYHYLNEALSHYSSWGAVSKCNQLSAKYPNLIKSGKQVTGTKSEQSADVFDLDISTVLKTTRAISSEIVIDKLLARLIRIIIENAGAQKGYIVLRTEKGLRIVAGFNLYQWGMEGYS